MVEKLNYESFLDSPSRLTNSPRGQKGEVSNDILKLTSLLARQLTFEVWVESPTHRSLFSTRENLKITKSK